MLTYVKLDEVLMWCVMSAVRGSFHLYINTYDLHVMCIVWEGGGEVWLSSVMSAAPCMDV